MLLAEKSWFPQRRAQRLRRRRLWVAGAGAAVPFFLLLALSLVDCFGIGPFAGLEPAVVEAPGVAVLSWLEFGS